ncbi:S49 family peptidase [Sphingobium sp. HDIP04]|uniref:S49 family peptidase n=1 Tax=Sphingobium sp. HDIP04 TaxID=428994 RepID=UPI0003878E83|nr:S49 family peptidase [Sphingobium sp. HDIP04]EQA97286.1 hypothetical protein L286_23460 [Sphingobium sp. HDIP04]
MSITPLWADRLFNHPIAIDRFKNDVLVEIAQLRLAGIKPAKITAATLDAPNISAMADDASHYSDAGRKPFRFLNNIAVIPVRGTLVQRGSYMDADSGLIGYDRIVSAVRAAQNDPDIKGVFSPFHTGGGECAGMFAAAEEIASMSKAEGGKPMFAYLDERACSAGYVLASAYDRIMGRRECQGGSIAAIINMLDTSRAYEKAGFQPIQIRAAWADRKALGGDGVPVDEATLEMLGALVDEASEMIVEFVSAMRSLPEAKIKDMRGAVFTGNELLKRGLIDDICSEREAWALLEEEIRSA